LQLYKQKAVGAKKGYELLKKKSDALKKAFRATLGRIVETKVRMGIEFKDASLALASAYFAAGDFSRNVIENVKKSTLVRLDERQDNVAGVKLAEFTLRGADVMTEGSNLIGLQGGGQAVAQARQAFKVYLENLIVIASL
jgi:V-type H+-transporting ATPase subunit D